jgi:flagellar hook-associated protein 1 FlgK
VSNFLSLNTALTGLRAAQVGMDTASHNVANANTVGFTRQRVNYVTRPAYASPVGPVGMGADVANITRTRDAFLDARVRSSGAVAGEFALHAELMGRLEGVLGEPENGVSGELSELWASFEDLALSPDDAAARRQVLSALGSLTARMRTVASVWDRLANDTGTRMDVTVEGVNDVLARVAALNKAIPDTLVREGTPNDLHDERDLLIDQLSSQLGVGVTYETDGTVTVQLDGVDLVRGLTAARLQVQPDHRLSDGTTVMNPGGELAAVRRFLEADLPATRGQLDALAFALGEALNAQHAQGLTTVGAAGAPLVAGHASAATIAVALSDPTGLAAGQGPAPVARHDGRNATALADLRTTPQSSGATIDEQLRELATGLGRDVAASTRAADAQEAIATAATIARQNVHGVSLDEEMVALMQFQRSLEAASRVMTAVDQALDVLINRTGLVGR